jgi:ADP-ribose pyrophosphatase YjhB (NUDIX family)
LKKSCFHHKIAALLNNPRRESQCDAMPDSIHLTVATVIHREGHFLMVRELDNGREVINQPAGHVEPGETLQEAALRETLEETGWHIHLTGFLGINHYRSPGNGKTYYRVSFVAEPLRTQSNARLDEDIVAAEWLSHQTIASSGQLRSPMVLSDINLFLTNSIYPLDIVKYFDDGSSL